MNKHINDLLSTAELNFEMKNYSNSINILLKIIKNDPENFSALCFLGICYAFQNEITESIIYSERALKIQPENIDLIYNIGKSYSLLKKYDVAISYYLNAIKLLPGHFESLTNVAHCLNAIGDYDSAIHYAKIAHSINPNNVLPYINIAASYRNLRDYESSFLFFEKALEIDNSCAELFINLGDLFFDMREFNSAIDCYKKFTSLKNNSYDGFFSMGKSYIELNNDLQAIDCFKRALELGVDLDFVDGEFLHLLSKNCNWDYHSEKILQIKSKIINSPNVFYPFTLLTLFDNPKLHKINAEKFSLGFNHTSFEFSKDPFFNQKKIRIGYFSADFHNHATSYLMAELFELHDRSRFEVFAFSFGPITNDEMQLRLKSSFDKFFDVSSFSDRDISKLSRQQYIEIAIDLKGYTKDSRPGIFFNRAAPIQVNYLGYPGTLGSGTYDYIIADNVLIPNVSRDFYSEKIVYLPDSYQVNDRKRFISDIYLAKSDLGLPNNSFVFCCFNNSFKIQPEIFKCWLNILKSVANSVLWLFEYNEISNSKLKHYAEKFDICPSRIIFAKRLPLSEHINRYRFADLFLDTFPYNAHTTASDALWAGLPVLTVCGNSFASRVCSSLLTSIKLPELITTSLEEYEAYAVNLANNPILLSDLKQKLKFNLLSTPLFDTPRFTYNLEKSFIEMHDRFLSNKNHDHIFI